MRPKFPVIVLVSATSSLLGLPCTAPEPAPGAGPDIHLSGVRAYRHTGESLDAVAEAEEATLSPDGSRARLASGKLLLPESKVGISAQTVDLDPASSNASGEQGATVEGPGYKVGGSSFDLEGDEGTVTLSGSVVASNTPPEEEEEVNAPPSPTVPGSHSPSFEPVNIDADEVVLHARTSTAVFTGDVVVTRSDTRLTCRRLTVSYAEDQSITHLLAEGSVRVTQGERVVTAKRADFDTVAEVLTLSGDAVLTQGGNVVRGERVVFTLATDEVRVERVRARVRVDEASSLGESRE